MKAYEEMVFNEVKLASSHLFKDVEKVCQTLGVDYKEIISQFNEAVEQDPVFHQAWNRAWSTAPEALPEQFRRSQAQLTDD